MDVTISVEDGSKLEKPGTIALEILMSVVVLETSVESLSEGATPVKTRRCQRGSGTPAVACFGQGGKTVVVPP